MRTGVALLSPGGDAPWNPPVRAAPAGRDHGGPLSCSGFHPFTTPAWNIAANGKRTPSTATGIDCVFGTATLFLSANATNTEPHVNQPTPSLSPGTAPAA